MLTLVKEILARRIQTHEENNYEIEKCRNELIEVLSQNETLTINILNQLNEEEILYTSEVFEEVAYNLQSIDYINCLKDIERKYPSLNIGNCIDVAISFIEFKVT